MTLSLADSAYLFVNNEVEEEEYDEPINLENNSDSTNTKSQGLDIAPADSIDSKNEFSTTSLCSPEYFESVDSIELDCWDISSWIIFLEEVEQGRAGGQMSVSDAYVKILNQFPLSAVLWKKVVDLYISEKNYVSAEAAFSNCLVKCRNVSLWQSYLLMTKTITVDSVKLTTPLTSSFYNTEHVKLVNAFERALDNVGFSLSAAPIWKDYLAFIRNGSMFDNNFVEVSKKLSALRSIFQRAVCIPMDGMDALWNDYEMFEKASATGGEEVVAAVLAEFNKRHLHAKSIHRDRKRLTASIEFDRFACPPTHSSAEMHQLELWNQWIKFELSNPDIMEPVPFQLYMRMLFDQFICCFRHNAEVWLSLVHFVLQHPDKKFAFNEARDVFREGIACNPGVSLLRVGLAELEETGVQDGLNKEIVEFSSGDITAAEEALREAFLKQPGGFTFSVYQRFVCRHRGKMMARKLFGSTLNMRNGDSKLGFELLMAHARLEDEVNCDVPTALRTFDLIREKYPSCMNNIVYIRSVFKILLVLGDLKQIQWMYQTACSYLAEALSDRSKAASLRGGLKIAGKTVLGVSAHESAKFELELVDAYLRAETVLNQSSIAFLNDVRDRRSVLRNAFEELDRMRYGTSSSVAKDGKVLTAVGVFDSASDLMDRYANGETAVLLLSEKDRDLRERSSNFKSSGGWEGEDRVRSSAFGEGQNRKESEILNMSAEFHLSLAGLPVILRDLLSKLPLHNGHPPDIDCFVRHVKSITLPPRPSVEDVSDAIDGDKPEGESKDLSAGGWLLDGGVDVDEWDDAPVTQQSMLGKGVMGRGEASSAVAEDLQEDMFRKRQKSKSTQL